MSVSLKQLILFCADVKRLSAFYCNYFGFSEVENAKDGWAVLNAGQVELALHKIPQEYLTTSVEDFKITDSNVKLVLDTDDLTGIHALLTKGNIEVGQIKQFPGYPYKLFDGNDPEGNVFQLRELL